MSLVNLDGKRVYDKWDFISLNVHSNPGLQYCTFDINFLLILWFNLQLQELCIRKYETHINSLIDVCKNSASWEIIFHWLPGEDHPHLFIIHSCFECGAANWHTMLYNVFLHETKQPISNINDACFSRKEPPGRHMESAVTLKPRQLTSLSH